MALAFAPALTKGAARTEVLVTGRAADDFEFLTARAVAIHVRHRWLTVHIDRELQCGTLMHRFFSCSPHWRPFRLLPSRASDGF